MGPRRRANRRRLGVVGVAGDSMRPTLRPGDACLVLYGARVREGLADKMTVFYAPKILGSGGTPLMGSLEVGAVGRAPGFRVDGVERFGEDVAVTLYPAREGEV